MRASVLSAVLIAPIMVLSACSGGGDDPSSGGSPSESAKVEVPSDPADLPDDLDQAKQLQVAMLAAGSKAEGADQEAVVKAWMKYHQAVADSLADLELDPALQDLPTKERDKITDQIADLTAKKQRIVGWSRDQVLSVAIQQDRAAGIHVCAENRTFAVDADNQPVADPVPLIDYVATFEKADGAWQVAQVEQLEQQDECIPDEDTPEALR